MALILELVDDGARLVTLIGVGGTGKRARKLLPMRYTKSGFRTKIRR